MLLSRLAEVKITIIGCTHGLHHAVKLKPGFLLIHTGDITEMDTPEEYEDFIHWFSRQPFDHKIFIAGNHDLYLEARGAKAIRSSLPRGVYYLENSGMEIMGMKIWGTPVTPYYLGMAFNRRPGKEIIKDLRKIPADTDLLITHGPPHGILDGGLGSEELLERVQQIQPLIHSFSHIHMQK